MQFYTKSSERGAGYFFYTNASVSNTPIKGVRTTCDVVKFSGKDKKSVSITMYTDTGYFIQTGYHTYANSTLPFIQLWKNGQQVGAPVTSFASPKLTFGQKQSFAIYNVISTNNWRIAVGGIETVEIALDSQSGTNAELYTEIGPASKPSRFPTLNFYPAIEVLVDNVWVSPTAAISSASSWGMQGKTQNTALQLNELNIGSSLPIIPSGTNLWQA